MEWYPPGLGRWVLQPLVDAGLTLEQVRDLVFRLAFDDVVHGESGSVGNVQRLVEDHAPEVRDAWAQMIGRMPALGEPAGRSGAP
ncbi:MAG TPA: hypothetical protein VK402_01035 [Blastococcus sp.]|nr:hypothetical protein [Blastococcus sp.]